MEVDLHGALGELVLYGMVRRLTGSAEGAQYMRDHMFRKRGDSDVSKRAHCHLSYSRSLRLLTSQTEMRVLAFEP
jgi:hypothetical protein